MFFLISILDIEEKNWLQGSEIVEFQIILV